MVDLATGKHASTAICSTSAWPRAPSNLSKHSSSIEHNKTFLRVTAKNNDSSEASVTLLQSEVASCYSAVTQSANKD